LHYFRGGDGGQILLSHQKRDRINPDEEGSELPDIDAARREALAAARELLAEAIKFERPQVPDCLIIVDADGHELMTVLLKEVLPKPLG
jgi:hypothetical protein